MFIISDIKRKNYASVNTVVEVYFPEETGFLKLYFVAVFIFFRFYW